jgi:AcrR family transcriptional regulator
VFENTFGVFANVKCSKEERMSDQPTLSRRDRRRLQTRAEILAAARELLLEVGPEELSLRQVARRADFSPAALYTYFPSKDALIASLFGESFERLDAYLRRVPADLAPDRRLVELGLAYMEFANDNPMDLRCMMLSTSLDLPPSSGKALGLGAARLIGETLRQGVQEGVLRQDGLCSAPQMAFGLWSLVHGMVTVRGIDLTEVAAEISADPRRVLEMYVDLLKAPR